jgi:SAM-dependent methyltransferase
LPQRVDLYSTYKHFTEQVLDAIRKETFGVDFGQNSWTTADEYDRFISWLDITSNQQVLEVASGSGGPAIYLATKTGCLLTAIDAHASAIETATTLARAAPHSDKVNFILADANMRLPFEDNTFDGLLCVDAMNHFPDRLDVLKEWSRVLRPGKRAVFTDPVVISGPVTNDELALRSSIGLFLFVPSGLNELLIAQAGLRIVEQEDVTDNAALIGGRWREARHNYKDDLLRIEGEERFESLQRFFDTVHKLTTERRLSRIVYVAEKQEIET